MKKFIIVSLVLGFVSVASAGLDLMWGASEYMDVAIFGNTVQISSEDVIGFLFNIKPDQGVLSNVVVSPDFAVLADPGAWYASYGAQICISAANISPVSGVILTFDFEPYATQIELIDSWAGRSEITFSTGTVYLVPEPATMGLLGIGGLYLSRRRK